MSRFDNGEPDPFGPPVTIPSRIPPAPGAEDNARLDAIDARVCEILCWPLPTAEGEAELDALAQELSAIGMRCRWGTGSIPAFSIPNGRWALYSWGVERRQYVREVQIAESAPLEAGSTADEHSSKTGV